MFVQIVDSFRFDSELELRKHYAEVRQRLRIKRSMPGYYKKSADPGQIELDPMSPPFVFEVPVIEESQLPATPEFSIIPCNRRGKISSTIVLASIMGSIPVDRLMRDRTGNTPHWRQIGQYAARKVFGASFPEIARVWGRRDHTTVLHSFNVIIKRMETDNELRSIVTDFCTILRESMTEQQFSKYATKVAGNELFKEGRG